MDDIIYEEDNENGSINVDSNAITNSKTDSRNIENDNFKNENEKVIQEKEMDDLADLKEKFKSILLKTPQDEGEDCIIYGMNANLLTENHKIKNGIIYCDDETFLQFLYPKSKKNPIKFKLSLASINDMSIGKSDGNLKTISLPLPDDCCLTIHYSNNLKHYDIIFKDSIQVELFITGVLAILQKRAKEGNSYDTDLLSLKRIWKEYDPEHNKFLNVEQFSAFLKNINFESNGRTAEQIFKEIDKNNENKIVFKQFISFYELLVTGEEFSEVFQKYSTSPNKSYLTIKGLIDFYEKEQHETLTSEEALKIICKYSKKAKKLESKGLNGLKLLKEKEKTINIKNSNESNSEATESMVAEYNNHTFVKFDISNNPNKPQTIKDMEHALKNAFQLSFREFVNLLIDKSTNSIYDREIMSLHQDMNKPLTDYYCHASHNTYLTGNQVHGETSVEMYAYVLKNGARFVDLDTFDGGDGTEPIITHWHFPVGEVNFKDCLINIKENAFIKNEFPVILSLENHCGPVCQEKMERYFLEILGRENLYIIDPKCPPLIYPSPNELRRKFIIKNKRKRIFGDIKEMKINYHNLFQATMNENKKKLDLSTSSNTSQTEISTKKSTNNKPENNNIIFNQDLKMKKRKTSTDVISEPPHTEKKDEIVARLEQTIAKEKIEEEDLSNKTDSDISEGIVEISDNKIHNNEEENMIKTFKNLENKNNLVPSNHFEIQYSPINSNSIINTTHKKKIRKKSYSSIEGDQSDINNFALPTFSHNVLNKLKQKYIIDEGIYPFSGRTENLDKQDQMIKKIEDLRIADSTETHKVHIITVERLANILGLVGVKYHKETFNPDKFLPWECISISESDVLKYITSEENKFKIIEFCQKSFLKIYPDGLRTNSSNHNPVMCWALGCQFAALNLQSTANDLVLLNKMFFKINGGSKCGYVLKPETLRTFNRENYKKMYAKPVYKIKFKILSGFHLHLTIPKKKKKVSGMFVKVRMKSMSTIENKGPKLVTHLINNNFLHPVWQSNSVVFDIYEPELSFIIVKLYSKKKELCLARAVIPVTAMALGYRVLEIYDNTCSKFDESYLIVKTNKIFN